MTLFLALVAHRTADLVDITDIIHLWVITAVTTAVTAPTTVIAVMKMITTTIAMSRGVDVPQMVLGAMTPISMMTSLRVLAMNWICFIKQYGTHALDVMLLEEAEDILVTLMVDITRMDEPQV